MKIICPKCNHEIPSKNVNITTDLAKCPKCNSISKVSEIVGKTKVKVSAMPPLGSKITVDTQLGYITEIKTTKKGIGGIDIFLIIFAIFWISFLCVWTVLAAFSSVFFALFSIPFWLVGIAMIVGVINRVSEIQIIRLESTFMELHRNRPIKPKKHTFYYSDISSIKMQSYKADTSKMFSNFGSTTHFNSNANHKKRIPVQYPSITSGIQTEYFFENTSQAEMEWIVNYLNNKIDKET